MTQPPSLIDALTGRRSVPARQLTDPAPDDAQLARMFRAAMSAPDHAGLTPWRFVVIRRPALPALGELLAEAWAARNPGAEPALIERQRQKAQRAPLVIGVVAHLRAGLAKVPEIEQLLAAGVAAGHLLLAAEALGFGAVWLSGENCRDRRVCRALGLSDNEHLLGFINIGTPASEVPTPERPDHAPLVREWTGPPPRDE
jgi:nitroreductase